MSMPAHKPDAVQLNPQPDVLERRARTGFEARHRLASGLFAAYAAYLVIAAWPLVWEGDGETVVSDAIPTCVLSLGMAVLLALGVNWARWLAMAVAVAALGFLHVVMPLTLFGVAACHRAGADGPIISVAAQCYFAFSVPTVAAVALLILCWKPFRKTAR